jgi:Bacterial Ig-like domain
LPHGTHAVAARLTDRHGNTSAESGAFTLQVDLMPPATPLAPDLASASDDGPSDQDNMTSIVQPTFTGLAEPGSRVELLVDNQVAAQMTTANGLWSLSVPSLSNGTHRVAARATDSAGNVSALSEPLSVVINAPESRLTLHRIPGAVLLSWPAQDPKLQLEACDQLVIDAWKPLEKAPTIEGTTKIVFISTTGATQFYYRLRRQP